MGKSLIRKSMLINRPSMSQEFTHIILQSLTKNYHLCRDFLKSSTTDDFYSMFFLVYWHICLELIYHKIMNLWRTEIFLVQPCGSYNTLHNSRHIANPQAFWVYKWIWVSEDIMIIIRSATLWGIVWLKLWLYKQNCLNRYGTLSSVIWKYGKLWENRTVKSYYLQHYF